jgi:cell division protein FtsQ
LVAVIAVLVWMFVDQAFYVAQADFTGLRYSSAPDVYRQAGIDGYSIFWVNGRETAERLEALPYVKQATVRSSLPNRVRIAIEERVPVAVWKAGGRDFWVDITGITMPVASAVETLPVLWDLDGSTVVADGKVDPELIAATRTLKEQQPDVSQFGYDRTNGLQFRTPAGTIVYLGKPDGLAERVRQLKVFQETLASEGRTPAEINWRVEDAFYIR